MAAGSQQKLATWLRDKEIKGEKFQEIIRRAEELKAEQKTDEFAYQTRLEAFKTTAADLGLSEQEIIEAARLVEQEEASRKKLLRNILIGLGVAVVIAVIPVLSARSSAKSKVSKITQAYEEVRLQQERAMAVKGQLKTLIQERDKVFYEQYKLAIDQAVGPELLKILARLSATHRDDEAFLKLMDEVTGGINRITVANRRYSNAYYKFERSLAWLEKKMISAEDFPPKPAGKKFELKHGH